MQEWSSLICFVHLMLFASLGFELIRKAAVQFIRLSFLASVKLVSFRRHETIQFVEIDIRQDWRANSSLWRAAIRVMVCPVLQVSCFQHDPDKIDEPCVIDPLFQQSEHYLVIHVVEEALDIHVDQPFDTVPGFLDGFKGRVA